MLFKAEGSKCDLPINICEELNLAKLKVWPREPPADYGRNTFLPDDFILIANFGIVEQFALVFLYIIYG